MKLFTFCNEAISSIGLSVQISTDALQETTERFHTSIEEEGMVDTQDELATHVGVQILKKGGNAVDAAVAVGFSLAITLPRAGNLGGGGFMLVYLQEEQKTIAVDFRTAAPKGILQDDFLFLKNNYDQRRFGYKASGVPGTVAGLIETHTKYGKLPLRKILKPVIDQARRGIKVSYDLSQAIGSANQINLDPESSDIYFEDGSPLIEHSLMTRQHLAWTINEIASKVQQAFYEGAIAKKNIQIMVINGGHMFAKHS